MSPWEEAARLIEDLNRKGVELKAVGITVYCRPSHLVSSKERERLKALRSYVGSILDPPPPDPVLEALCQSFPDASEDLRQERAAIMEFNGKFSRAEAEARSGLGPTRKDHP